jgi:hypothetical protein
MRKSLGALGQPAGDAQRQPRLQRLRVRRRLRHREQGSSQAVHGVIPLAFRAFANA